MLNLDEINNRCDDIIKNNKIYLDKLSLKIGTINKTKYTKYKKYQSTSINNTIRYKNPHKR